MAALQDRAGAFAQSGPSRPARCAANRSWIRRRCMTESQSWLSPWTGAAALACRPGTAWSRKASCIAAPPRSRRRQRDRRLFGGFHPLSTRGPQARRSRDSHTALPRSQGSRPEGEEACAPCGGSLPRGERVAGQSQVWLTSLREFEMAAGGQARMRSPSRSVALSVALSSKSTAAGRRLPWR